MAPVSLIQVVDCVVVLFSVSVCVREINVLCLLTATDIKKYILTYITVKTLNKDALKLIKY